MVDRLKIVVLGYVVRGPLAGNTWHHLQYVLGFAALGHDVYFVEDSDDYDSCCDATTHTWSTDPTNGLRYADGVFGRLGLAERWGYYDGHSGTWWGPRRSEAAQWCRDADVIVNVSAVNPLREWSLTAPVRVFVDTDPVFVQIRHIQDAAARERADLHSHFYSFGTNVESDTSRMPSDGYDWRSTRQPVVLERWPFTAPAPGSRFTTVMQWESYPPAVHGGVTFGMKSTSFSMIEDLPSHTVAELELALGSASAPRSALRAKGWFIRDPIEVSIDIESYQDYIRSSFGELTVAKHGYVVGHTGWFSERSANYMASGRPVITQDTGFGEWLPEGDGVLAFHDLQSARDAVERVVADPLRHSRAARTVAEEHFDARTVLRDMLDSL